MLSAKVVDDALKKQSDISTANQFSKNNERVNEMIKLYNEGIKR